MVRQQTSSIGVQGRGVWSPRRFFLTAVIVSLIGMTQIPEADSGVSAPFEGQGGARPNTFGGYHPAADSAVAGGICALETARLADPLRSTWARRGSCRSRSCFTLLAHVLTWGRDPPGGSQPFGVAHESRRSP